MSGARAGQADLDEAMARLSSALHGFEHDDDELGPELSGPERELLAALAPSDAGFSFAAGGSDDDDGPAMRLIDELIERATTAAAVDTAAGGQVQVSTRIGRGGTVVCSLAPSADTQLLARHIGAIEQALATQREHTLLLISTLQMASKIAVAAGTGNPLLAVPAAMRFIRDIMAEREARAANAND